MRDGWPVEDAAGVELGEVATVVDVRVVAFLETGEEETAELERETETEPLAEELRETVTEAEPETEAVELPPDGGVAPEPSSGAGPLPV